MSKFIFLLLIIAILPMKIYASIQNNAGPFLEFSAGETFNIAPGNTSTVSIVPAPSLAAFNLQNHNSKNVTGSLITSFGIGYAFQLTPNLQLEVVEKIYRTGFQQEGNSALSGISNNTPYHYNVAITNLSTALRLIYTLKYLQLYMELNAGVAWLKAYGYTENSQDPSLGYASHTNRNFAPGIALGVIKPITSHVSFVVNAGYLDAGTAQLGEKFNQSPSITSGEAIQRVNELYFSAGLKIYF